MVPAGASASTDRERQEDNDIDEAHKAETQWHSQRLDWATLLHRVYDIDALRCECGGELRFEEIIESPKEAQAFLALHQIESPRRADSQEHVASWSEAPNLALLNCLHPDRMSGSAEETDPSTQAATPPTSKAPESDWDWNRRDELPSEEAYFQDEIPPD